ncbi:hypothetical protein ONZ43_g3122 [Nemania bipapillata]|uniref:Uncharacterized protein n=1 Tax=Nemania bipapillata TaxID=110536 RepID=A0ACC2IY00_9PEZI|nr:hypothetical protein ONZ43_g3122 [Nemania bipapillata]
MDLEAWGAVQPSNLVQTTKDNEWMTYEITPMHYVNISMCFVGFNVVDANVSMTASAPLFEPKENWVSPESMGGSTRLYRRLLGTDLEYQSHGERGILTLDNPGAVPISDFSTSTDPQTASTYRVNAIELKVYSLLTNNLAQASPEAYANGSLSDTSFTACAFCNAYGINLNPQMDAVFTDTINHTRRAALSMDSWVFMMIQAAYSDILQFFDKSEAVNISSTSLVQAPGDCTNEKECQGFLAVLALVLVYTLCVVCITALYLTKTRYSKHGQIWHSISQLQCDELGGILREANEARDCDIEKLVKDSSRDHLMKIGISTDGSRIEAVKFKDDPNTLSANHSILTKMTTTAHKLFRNPFTNRKNDA